MLAGALGKQKGEATSGTPGLLALSLHENGLGEAGAATLAEALKTNGGLATLWLGKSRSHAQSAAPPCALCAPRAPPLTSLHTTTHTLRAWRRQERPQE